MEDKAKERITREMTAVLAYVFAWPGGLLFLFISKDNFVKFHAAQSIVVFGLLNALLLIPVLGTLLFGFVSIAWILMLVVLAVKANAGESWEVPYLGPIAKQLLAKMS